MGDPHEGAGKEAELVRMHGIKLRVVVLGSPRETEFRVRPHPTEADQWELWCSLCGYWAGPALPHEESGLVDEVEVLDGRDFDQACKDINGQRKSLAWARANPIQHPNCRRAMVPIVKERT